MSRRGLPIPKRIPSYAIDERKVKKRKRKGREMRERDSDLEGGKWRRFIVGIGE